MIIRRMRQLLLLLGDLTSLYGALFLALSIRSGQFVALATFQMHIPLFSIVFAGAIVMNYIFGLYEGFGIKKRDWSSYLAIVSSNLIVFFGATLFFYILPDAGISPKTILLLTIALGSLGAIILRIGLTVLFGWKDIQLTIGIIGEKNDTTIKDIETLLSTHTDYTLLWINTTPTVDEIQSVRQLITSPDSLENSETKKLLYQYAVGHVAVVSLYEFYERLTGKVATAACNDEWFISNIPAPAPYYIHIRTIIDYTSGLLLFGLFLAASLIVAPLIKLTSSGPLCIRQKRIGKSGKPFTLYKFRTMYALSADGSAETNGAVFSKKGDKRITPVGRFLRKTRIDELPQCINLLRRDISIIGPRPERPEIIAGLEADAPYFAARTLIKPGITGWAAVKQHYTDSKASTIEKLQYDLFYIKHRSLWLDIKILLLTVRTVLHMKGQ